MSQTSTLIADRLDEYDQIEAFEAIRATRRRNRITRLDKFDAFYKAYLSAIIGGLLVWGIASGLGHRHPDLHHLALVKDRGASFLGLAVAVAVAIGVRSGGRGGPLAFERAEVRHLLMAPLDKRYSIRRPALRQLRHIVFLGIAAGGVLGAMATQRLPESPVLWIACDALFGAVVISVAYGVAMLAGGLQVKRWQADLVSLAVVVWSICDATLRLKSSPMTWIGSIALWPLKFDVLGVIGLVLAVIAPVIGAVFVNRLSIEAAERRSRLIGQLRFAATLQDVRTVMVLQRQLAQEHTRTRPWIKRKPTKKIGVRNGNVALGVFVRRAMAGFLRWPLVRYVRLVIFVGIAGVSLIGVWGGTSALIVVGGVALWLAALDLVEGLAQEMDHPDRAAAIPRNIGSIQQKQLLTPFCILFVLELIAYGLLAVFGDSNIVSQFSPVVLLSTLCAIGGAAIAVTQQPNPAASAVDTPEIAGAKFIVRAALPPGLAILGLVPVVAGQRAWDVHHTLQSIAQGQSKIITAVFIASVWPIVWVRYGHEFKTAAKVQPIVTKKEEAEKKRDAHRKDVRPAAKKTNKSKGKK